MVFTENVKSHQKFLIRHGSLCTNVKKIFQTCLVTFWVKYLVTRNFPKAYFIERVGTWSKNFLEFPTVDCLTNKQNVTILTLSVSWYGKKCFTYLLYCQWQDTPHSPCLKKSLFSLFILERRLPTQQTKNVNLTLK